MDAHTINPTISSIPLASTVQLSSSQGSTVQLSSSQGSSSDDNTLTQKTKKVDNLVSYAIEQDLEFVNKLRLKNSNMNGPATLKQSTPATISKLIEVMFPPSIWLNLAVCYSYFSKLILFREL